MQKQPNFASFLTDRGKEYFFLLKGHISQNEISQTEQNYQFEIDDIEVAMLANEYDLYFSNMEFCQKNGYSFTTGSNNGYSQIRPEFSVMKNAYQNILKHSAKFGITPGDRAKLFGAKIGKPTKPMEFDI
jgi:hypothetical protein